jgi:hypothetical protein
MKFYTLAPEILFTDLNFEDYLCSGIILGNRIREMKFIEMKTKIEQGNIVERSVATDASSGILAGKKIIVTHRKRSHILIK